jgi:hypothetical protein
MRKQVAVNPGESVEARTPSPYKRADVYMEMDLEPRMNTDRHGSPAGCCRAWDLRVDDAVVGSEHRSSVKQTSAGN